MRIYFNDGTYEDYFNVGTSASCVATLRTILRERLGTDVENLFNDILKEQNERVERVKTEVLDTIERVADVVEDELSGL